MPLRCLCMGRRELGEITVASSTESVELTCKDASTGVPAFLFLKNVPFFESGRLVRGNGDRFRVEKARSVNWASPSLVHPTGKRCCGRAESHPLPWASGGTDRNSRSPSGMPHNFAGVRRSLMLQLLLR